MLFDDPSAFVARNDAPLIGQTQARAHSQTKGDDQIHYFPRPNARQRERGWHNTIIQLRNRRKSTYQIV
jgi:hypothetical protein